MKKGSIKDGELMKKKVYIIVSIITLFFSILPFISNSMSSTRNPYTYYRVYYDGALIGTIKSEDELLDYINESNSEYKEKYGVDSVYKPNNLIIKSYKTYESLVDDTYSVYKKIEALASFTLRGYEFTINNGENSEYIYVLDESIFSNAVDTVIKTFVDSEEYEDYKNGVSNSLNKIDNIYVKESISYKEVYIPVNEKIYTDSVDLAQHLLYGDNPDEKKYTVKLGDTIESVSFANKISTGDFLLSNPEYNSADNLLAVNTKVTIKPLNPAINVVVEKFETTEDVKSYNVETTYDDQKNQQYYKVVRKGENGYEKITRRIETINGVDTYVLTLSKEELKPAISQIDVKGSKVISKVGGSVWGWPTESGYYIIDRYRYRYSPVYGTYELHTGLDITGTGCYSKIYAANNGEVIMANKVDNGSYGLFVVINHNNGYSTLYGHMISVSVNVGDIVEKGQVIGLMGSTGDSTGCHLHFELWSGYPWAHGYRLNPNVISTYNK